MSALIVIENLKRWDLHIPGAEVVSARDYLTNPRFSERRRAKVFNLCRNYSYQSLGYYVSLLAAARGHKPLPSVTTLQDLRTSAVVRVVAEDIEELIQRAFSSLKSDRFELSVYFGRNMAKKYDRVARALFNHFPAPFLRAEFVKEEEWHLENIRPIATSEIPETHREFVREQATRYFSRPGARPPSEFRYDLAILVDSNEDDPPSDEKAIQKFTRAARSLGMDVTLIEKDDYGRLGEFDALFIRETTQVSHHTYRFASRAEAEGLVVIDDPESIVRCTNKVYQAELFNRHGIPSPKTMIVHKDNVDMVGRTLGFPCVLKRPDTAFSTGVEKAENEEDLRRCLEHFLDDSDLVVAQEWTPSGFDWRVGVIAGRPLHVCQYHMARGHWQIQNNREEGWRKRYGRVTTLPYEKVPPEVIDLGVRAANLVGDGLYGVDIKDLGGRYVVMEVNDNPSIEAGYEDKVLKDSLYMSIMRVFYERLEKRGR